MKQQVVARFRVSLKSPSAKQPHKLFHAKGCGYRFLAIPDMQRHDLAVGRQY